MRTFSIPSPKGERRIGSGEPCFIIAEMSANHGQDYDKAVAIVKAAAVAGADAIKLQSYIPETITLDSHKPWFMVGGKDNPEAWKGQTFYELYQKAFTPREWHAPLKALAESLGLIFFPTPYSPADVDFLETLDPALYKVASYEATDIPFLQRLAQTGRPIIMSVGFATLEEIKESVAAIQSTKNAGSLVLLHCVTSYTDAPHPEMSHLSVMRDMAERFDVPTGFSDNNAGIVIPVLAAAMGACVVEKHFVMEGDVALDSRFSLGHHEFKEMVDQIRAHETIAGSVSYGPQTQEEKYNRGFRRSLFAIKDIRRGEAFTMENIRSLRPANGLEPKYLPILLKKTAAINIEAGTPLSADVVEGKLS